MTTKNSQNEKEELKSCPFCGRKAEMFIHNGYNDPSRKGMRYIECYDDNEDGCGCKTEWFEEEQEAKLVEYWNTRPLLSQPAKREKKELVELRTDEVFNAIPEEYGFVTRSLIASLICSKFATKPSNEAWDEKELGIVLSESWQDCKEDGGTNLPVDDEVIVAQIHAVKSLLTKPSKVISKEEIKKEIYKLELDGSISQHDVNDISTAIFDYLEGRK